MLAEEIIKRPLVTEKAETLREENNQYVFEVDRRANKIQIRNAVTQAFGVEVDDVRTWLCEGRLRRMGRKPNKKAYVKVWKKAIETLALAKAEEIDFYEGARRPGCQAFQAHFAGSSSLWHQGISGYMRKLDSRDAVRSPASTEAKRCEGAVVTTTGASPRASVVAATSAGYRVIDFRREKFACPRRWRTIQYDPNRTARIALLHYADGDKSYILCPTASRSATVVSLAARRTSSRVTHADHQDAARHDDSQHRAAIGKGGQLVRSADRRTAHGEEGRLRPGAPALRRGPHGSPELSRDHRSGGQRRACSCVARQGRPLPLEGSSSA